MARSLLIAGIVLTVIAILCTVAALGTTSWMQACVSMKTVLNNIESALPSDQSNQLQRQSAQMPDMDICIASGLFRISMHVSNMFSYNLNLPPNSYDIFMEATAGLMLTGVIVSIIGLVFLSLSVCSRSMNAQRKVSASAYARIGVGVLIAATTLFGIGVTVYTVEQTKNLHNPQAFMMQMGNAMQNMMSKMDVGAGGPQGYPSSFDGNPVYGGNGRKRRQSDSPYDFPGDQGENNFNDFNNFAQITMPNSVYGYVSPSHQEHNIQNLPDTAEMMKQYFSGLDPIFGYSFYLAWLGFIFALLAVVVTALTCRRTSLYADDLQPVL